jgi:hypothetical protein
LQDIELAMVSQAGRCRRAVQADKSKLKPGVKIFIAAANKKEERST